MFYQSKLYKLILYEATYQMISQFMHQNILKEHPSFDAQTPTIIQQLIKTKYCSSKYLQLHDIV